MSISFKFRDRSVVVGSAKGVGRFHHAEVKNRKRRIRRKMIPLIDINACFPANEPRKVS